MRWPVLRINIESISLSKLSALYKYRTDHRLLEDHEVMFWNLESPGILLGLDIEASFSTHNDF